MKSAPQAARGTESLIVLHDLAKFGYLEATVSLSSTGLCTIQKSVQAVLVFPQRLRFHLPPRLPVQDR